MLPNEIERPRPLNGEEIKTGLVFKVCEAVEDAMRDRLGKTCNLYGHGYAKFKGKIAIHLELDDFGLTTIDNSEMVFGENEELSASAVKIDAEVDIPEMPPNKFRVETEQPVTVIALENGRAVERNVKYQPRSKKKN